MADLIYLAANNPDLGGGEQMLLRHAAALLELGHRVIVVAPDRPPDVLDAAAAAGADVVPIRSDGRSQYIRRLRSWDRSERKGLLWCHGLVPALATAGHSRRVVHLHQLPRGRAQRAALAAARIRSLHTLAPSAFIAGQVRRSIVCANWTDDLVRVPRTGRQCRVGFMGRLSTDKGLDVLAHAVRRLGSGEVDLVVAGDDRWVPEDQRLPVAESLAVLGLRVHTLGRVSPATFFNHIDLAVFPSRVAESFGLVVAEAMAAGVPFVVSDAGALPEVAGPDHPWVARRGDAEDLARVIERTFDATPDEVRSVTDRARLRWEEQYSPNAGRRRVQQLLEDMGVR